MSNFFYSASTGGFYLREIHGDSIPADAVEVTPEEHNELFLGQDKGMVIVADQSGKPVLSMPLAPSQEELEAKCKEEARRLLQATDFSQLQDVVSILKNKPDFDSYRSKVRGLLFAPVPNPVWPEQPNPIWE